MAPLLPMRYGSKRVQEAADCSIQFTAQAKTGWGIAELRPHLLQAQFKADWLLESAIRVAASRAALVSGTAWIRVHGGRVQGSEGVSVGLKTFQG